MLKYFHIIKFLMTHDLTFLKQCLSVECFECDFKWSKFISRFFKSPKPNHLFYFWWRIASEMKLHGNKKQIKIAEKINFIIYKNCFVQIPVGTMIGLGFKIIHFTGIVIHEDFKCGKNLSIYHNVTIGAKSNKNKFKVIAGDNLIVCSGSYIIGGKINIGDNVTIGAMSYIDKDIPDNCTVFTKKTNEIIIR